MKHLNFTRPVLVFCLLAAPAALAQSDWPFVGGDAAGTRYSTLTQINRKNVKDLEVAWTFRTGGLREGYNSAIQCPPIVVEGVMYLTGVDLTVFALDPATGKELWRFNPQRSRDLGLRNRGVAFWSDGKKNGEWRVILAIPDCKMFSLDARTGKLDMKFGRDGVVNLRDGIERDIEKLTYGSSAPPAIYNGKGQDLIILGFSNNEGYESAPGDIRAFDARTGKPVWRFHTVPRPCEFGHDTWLPAPEGKKAGWMDRGGANAWGGVRVDQKNGIVFAGLGSAAHDFYGGNRETTSSPDAWSRSMRARANGYGIFKPCGTICGITTFQRRRPSQRSTETEGRSKWSRRRRKQATCGSLSARPVSRSLASSSAML
jgi:quinoprotein glucose dehydrogenase